jgi:hypothetical protein
MKGLKLTDRGELVKEILTLVTAIAAVVAFSAVAFLIHQIGA